MKTVIAMAREAKVTPELIGENGAYFARIEHLVELARADEREACAQVGMLKAINGIEVAAAIRARGQK